MDENGSHLNQKYLTIFHYLALRSISFLSIRSCFTTGLTARFFAKRSAPLVHSDALRVTCRLTPTRWPLRPAMHLAVHRRSLRATRRRWRRSRLPATGQTHTRLPAGYIALRSTQRAGFVPFFSF